MSVSFRLAEGRLERRRVMAFVRSQARRLYGGPTPLPSQILFFAELDRGICGTISLDFADSAGKLPLESTYCFDRNRTPWRFEPEMIAQIGKWWATRPRVAVRLMHAAHVYALAAGKAFGLVEAKPRIITRVGEFGMAHVEVPGALLRIREMSSSGKGYHVTPPFPQLYMSDIRANAAALAHHIECQEQPAEGG